MAKVSIMSWNVENWGVSKNYAEMIDFVANVIDQYQPVVVAILEVRSNLGASLGTRLCTALDGLVGKANTWDYQASPQYGTRLEQYLWLWRKDKVAVTKTQFKDTWRVPAPVYSKALTVELGFPRLKGTDHPPYLGFFTFKNKAAVPMSALHAPEPGYKPNVTKACANLAEISDFTGATAGALMGDFNISPSDPASGNGKKGFGPVVGLGYAQQLVGIFTSLNAVPSAAPPGFDKASMFSSQYDNLFLKPGADGSGGAVLDLVEDCVNDSYPSIAKALRKYVYAAKNQNTGTGTMVAKYTTIFAAFADFRYWGSDHFPIIVDVNWG